MTDITYTSQAKDDLAKIHWRTRERIISSLGSVYGKNPTHNGFKKIHNSELIKLNIDDHVVLGRVEEKQLNIITVKKKQTIKLPD